MTAHWGMPDPAAVEGNAGGDRAGLRRHLSDAEQPHRRLRQPDDGRPRPAVAAERQMDGRSAKHERRQPGAAAAARSSPHVAAEALGTALLLAMVVGSGIMGERLAGGNVAVALLANALATGAALVVLITVFGPLSGAHFNPAVTLLSRCAARSPGATPSPISPVQIVAGGSSASGWPTPCSRAGAAGLRQLRDGPANGWPSSSRRSA